MTVQQSNCKLWPYRYQETDEAKLGQFENKYTIEIHKQANYNWSVPIFFGGKYPCKWPFVAKIGFLMWNLPGLVSAGFYFYICVGCSAVNVFTDIIGNKPTMNLILARQIFYCSQSSGSTNC